jgi:hypothetical protein
MTARLNKSFLRLLRTPVRRTLLQHFQPLMARFYNFDNNTKFSTHDPVEHLKLIHFAAAGNLNLIRELLTENSNINVSDSDYDGRTALHLAAQEGHYHVAEFLIKSGANVFATDRWNNSSLQCATQNKRNDIAMLLRDYGAKLRSDDLTVELKASKAVEETPTDFQSRIESIQHIFNRLAGVSGEQPEFAPLESLITYLKQRGLDPRHNKVLHLEILQLCNYDPHAHVFSWQSFLDMMLASDKSSVLKLALYDRLVIPQWDKFCEKIKEIFHNVRRDVKDGKNASYIPELSTIDPELFAISICTADGQQVPLIFSNFLLI